MAALCGYTKESETRSLLSSQPGFACMEVKFPRATPKWLVWKEIRKIYPSSACDAIRGLLLTKTGDGAVFDIDTENLKAFENTANGSFELKKCEVLPELDDSRTYNS